MKFGNFEQPSKNVPGTSEEISDMLERVEQPIPGVEIKDPELLQALEGEGTLNFNARRYSEEGIMVGDEMSLEEIDSETFKENVKGFLAQFGDTRED